MNTNLFKREGTYTLKPELDTLTLIGELMNSLGMVAKFRLESYWSDLAYDMRGLDNWITEGWNAVRGGKESHTIDIWWMCRHMGTHMHNTSDPQFHDWQRAARNMSGHNAELQILLEFKQGEQLDDGTYAVDCKYNVNPLTW